MQRVLVALISLATAPPAVADPTDRLAVYRYHNLKDALLGPVLSQVLTDGLDADGFAVYVVKTLGNVLSSSWHIPGQRHLVRLGRCASGRAAPVAARGQGSRAS